jgi:hypothetical protein
MSTMPGYRASHRRYGEYPARDDWVRYLEDYVGHIGPMCGSARRFTR